MDITKILDPLQVMLLAWSLVSITTCVAIWIIIKLLKCLANDESYIWEMCQKYPNDTDLGRKIRKDAWSKKEKKGPLGIDGTNCNI